MSFEWVYEVDIRWGVSGGCKISTYMSQDSFMRSFLHPFGYFDHTCSILSYSTLDLKFVSGVFCSVLFLIHICL